jgi:hypothetical protein
MFQMAKANFEVSGHELTVFFKYQPITKEKKCLCGQDHTGFVYEVAFEGFVEDNVDVADARIKKQAEEKLKRVLGDGSAVNEDCLEKHLEDIEGKDGVHFDWSSDTV